MNSATPGGLNFEATEKFKLWLRPSAVATQIGDFGREAAHIRAAALLPWVG